VADCWQQLCFIHQCIIDSPVRALCGQYENQDRLILRCNSQQGMLGCSLWRHFGWPFMPYLRHIRLAYQPPANSTFLSEQISHQ
jgi:hypothetical protein